MLVFGGGGTFVFLPVLGCPCKLVTIVSKLVYNLFRGRIQPTYRGVIIIHLLSTMDIPVVTTFTEGKHAESLHGHCWWSFLGRSHTAATREASPNRNPWKVQVDHLKNPMCFLHSLKPIAVGPVKDGAK